MCSRGPARPPWLFVPSGGLRQEPRPLISAVMPGFDRASVALRRLLAAVVATEWENLPKVTVCGRECLDMTAFVATEWL